MNREIKFRVWDGQQMTDPEDTYEDEFYILLDGSIRRQVERGGNYHRSMENEKAPGVNVLMQFIGLKTIDGQDIYEGDIVRYATGIGVVEFSNQGEVVQGAFCIRRRAQSREIEATFSFKTAFHRVEVIGNVYENPELLPDGNH